MSRDRQLAAAAKKQRKEAEATAKRQRDHNHSGATRADRAGWHWLDKQP